MNAFCPNSGVHTIPSPAVAGRPSHKALAVIHYPDSGSGLFDLPLLRQEPCPFTRMSSKSSRRDLNGPGRAYGQDEYILNTRGFADLPVEMLVHISLLLPIPSVISLRLVSCQTITPFLKIYLTIHSQCCKTLATMANERIIWMTAARRLCTDYFAFGCSYQFEDMTTLDLEDVATAPYRFSARLRTEFVAKTLQPTVTRSIVPEKSNIFGGFRSVTLVPGGRFLLTCTKHGVLQLWDLGLTPNATPSSQPSATTDVAGWLTRSKILVQPSSDQSGILVLMMLVFSQCGPF